MRGSSRSVGEDAINGRFQDKEKGNDDIRKKAERKKGAGCVYNGMNRMISAVCMGAMTVVAWGAEDVAGMRQDVRGGQVVVTCEVNGKPLRLMMDTGASHTLLDKASAQALAGIEWVDTSKMQMQGNSAQRPEVAMVTMAAGGEQQGKMPVLVVPLGHVQGMMAEKIDGILGMDVMHRLAFTFDFGAGKFSWGAPATPEGLSVIPGAYTPLGLFNVRLVLKGQEVSALLDTGCGGVVLPPSCWPYGIEAMAMGKVGDINSARAVKMGRGKAADVEIAPGVTRAGLVPMIQEGVPKPLLGVDAFRGLRLVHIPRGMGQAGVYLVGKSAPKAPKKD